MDTMTQDQGLQEDIANIQTRINSLKKWLSENVQEFAHINDKCRSFPSSYYPHTTIYTEDYYVPRVPCVPYGTYGTYDTYVTSATYDEPYVVCKRYKVPNKMQKKKDVGNMPKHQKNYARQKCSRKNAKHSQHHC